MIYFDTSVLVPLFLVEPRSSDSAALFARGESAISDLGVAEFSSAISIGVRMGKFQPGFARRVLEIFDDWVSQHDLTESVVSADFAEATRFTRRFELALRTPDALHISIAKRLGATLATFDARLEAAARAVGVKVVG